MTVSADPTDPAARLPTRPQAHREFYIDLWRAAAIARVLLYHGIERGWLTVLFPAMGLMFALGGSLTARSLAGGEQAGRPARAVVRGRFRRVLPSLWVFAVVSLTLSLWLGWGRDHNWTERVNLVWWLLPLHAPTRVGGTNALEFTGIVWYLTAYLWFVVLSPALLRVLRAWPRATLAAAILLPAALYLHVATIGGWIEPQAYDLAEYGACWLLGMAHRDGQLARIRNAVLWPVVGVLATVTIVSLVATGQRVDTVDLDRIAVLNALWSAAFAATVLRLTPTEPATAWLARSRVLAPAVRAVNARALTIYLWHYPCLLLARWLTGYRPGVGHWWSALLMVGLTAVACLAFGWVEDLAARRPVRHLPWRTAQPG